MTTTIGSEATASHLDVRSPIDGSTVATVAATTPTEVVDIAARLRDAQPEWHAIGPRGRAEWVRKWRDWIADNTERLVAMIQQETGKAYGDAISEPGYSLLVASYWIDHAEQLLADEHPESTIPTQRLIVEHAPYPLVGVISPWNWPLTMPMLDIPAALMAGSAVLSKPSELTPLTWNEVVRAWREEIGAPDVLACVNGGGNIGVAVVDTVDMIQFTGSVRTGRLVAARAGERLIPCGLELGGKDPMVVLADADVERAANAAVWGACVNGGQGCSAIERVYVEGPIYDRFVELVTEKTRALRLGTDIDTPFTADVGSMSSEAQLRIVEDHVEQAVAAGARVLTGGKRADAAGWYYEPTVLVDVDHSMAVMRDETFGPVVPIMKVADVDEAMRLANDSDFGLCGSIWTGDRERGIALGRQLEVGALCVNDACVTNFQLALPSGGWKSSGVGARFGGAEGIRKYTRARATLSTLAEPATEPHWYPFGG
ncbi:aldehyde dehydrogenase family protein [Rhodococcus sp. IEGM 1305]|uniref:aldehyde dehydrogenase family protein n=1 Tax=Rhodococcus sp. IEGM 1305 TaxID=3047092 RepID=UPI0024B86920|nr:aldehyde dehydrogenase family protein [Rhodococcus sp. IEGM 1305]MDI9953302.1 aldehyde dehydrogenase family protein [Rhodococcus sp. IEGM 1305]